MLDLIGKIEEVPTFKAHDHKLYYLSEDLTTLRILDENLDSIKSVSSISSLKNIFPTGANTFVSDRKGVGYWLDESRLRETGFRLDWLPDTLNLSICYDSKQLESSLYDLQTLKLIWKNQGVFRFAGDLLVANDINTSTLLKDSFSLIDTLSGNVIWNFTVPTNEFDWYRQSNYLNEAPALVKADIKRIIGLYKNTVWIALNSGRILGLDHQTGELKVNLPAPSNFSEHFTDGTSLFWIAQNTYLDITKGQLFGIHDEYYWEVDLEKPIESYVIYDASASCQDHGLRMIHWGGWKQDRIYFWEGSIDTKVGCFDRLTKQIVWSYDIKEAAGKFPAIRNVTHEGNNLYVLDHAITLHIFKEIK